MRRNRVVLAAILATLVAGAFAIELLSSALYYAKRGKLFYVDDRGAVTAASPHTAAQAVFHPYFSYIHRAGRTEGDWTTNNMGFQLSRSLASTDPGCCDYPLARRDGEVLVGIFGGSVATGFALAMQSDSTFSRKLASLPTWSGRRVRILSFAMPGFKQPQQLMTLAYFLSLGQRFDLVINIDGFNELVTSSRNRESGVEPAFPADTLWGEWGRQLEQAAGRPGSPQALERLFHRLDEARWRRQAADCSLAACYAWSSAMANLAARRGSRIRASPTEAENRESLFPTRIQSAIPKDADTLAYAAERWADASRAMSALAAANDAVYLHVIQPNQWWRAAAGDYEPIERDHIYKWVIPLIEAGYPELAARAPELARAGVAVLDATAIFRGRASRDVYVDDCCHYTDAGNALLGEAIAARVREVAASRAR